MYSATKLKKNSNNYLDEEHGLVFNFNNSASYHQNR